MVRFIFATPQKKLGAELSGGGKPYTNAQHYHETGEPKHSNLTESDGWLCWAIHMFSFVLQMFFPECHFNTTLG